MKVALRTATLLIIAGGVLTTMLNPILSIKKEKENKRKEKENRKERVKEKEKARVKQKEVEATAIFRQLTPPPQFITLKNNNTGKITTEKKLRK